MAAATMALKISDGTTTVNLVYHSTLNPGYQLAQDWAPNVPRLHTNELGGYGPYEDVVEDIPIRVFGTSMPDAYSKADVVNRLLDQAERWWLKKQGVNPVTLQYSPPGATVSTTALPLQAVILGRADANAGMFTLPPTFNKMVNGYVIDGIRLKILRRQWIGANDNTGASSAAANATVLTQSFGVSHPIMSALGIEVAGFHVTNTPIIRAGVLCIGSQPTDIQVLEAEAGTATTFTSVADATNLARGGSHLRYTPTDVNPKTSGNLTMSFIGGNIAIIAAVRNNHASTTFRVKANVSGFGNPVSTPEQLIDASTLNPRLIIFDPISAIGNKVTLTITASAAAGTLDIDFLIVVNLRDESVAVLTHPDTALANVGAGNATFVTEFRPNNSTSPAFYASGTSGNANMTWNGVLPLLTVGQNVYALWTAPNGQYWRFTNTSNAIVNITINCARYRAYLTPQ